MKKKIIFKKIMAFLLAGSIVVTSGMFNLPPSIVSLADLVSEGWPGYCIDGNGFTYRDGKKPGDVFTQSMDISTTGLNIEEQGYAYWAILSYLSTQKEDKFKWLPIVKIKKFISTVNTAINTGKSNLPPIKIVSESDIKGIIHSDAIRSKYPWIKKAVEDPFAYFAAAGMAGGGNTGSTQGGGTLPAELQGTNEANPYVLKASDGSFFMEVNDAAFLKAMQGHLVFPEGNNGWSAAFESNGIRFTNSDGSTASALVKFDTAGTAYASAAGGIDVASKEELYAKYLIVYDCTKCGNQHFSTALADIGYTDGSCPMDWHQRLALASLPDGVSGAFLRIGGEPTFGGEIGVEFNMYNHEETMTAQYNVDLYKYDYETGKPLADAVFEVWERFDDKEQISSTDGAETLCKDNYVATNPVTWEGWRKFNAIKTDEAGKKSYSDIRSYHYKKTFCDGHPAPTWVEVPELETDELTGEAVNQDEVDAALILNQDAAKLWLSYYEACDEYAADHDGVHFHWLMDGVSKDSLENVAGTGEPSTDETAEPAEEDSYERSGCEADCEATYQKFIGLKYSYTFKEMTARYGYIVHGTHKDDIPIEVVTTNSSEDGAVCTFANEYSRDIRETTTTGEAVIENANISHYWPRLASASDAAKTELEIKQAIDTMDAAAAGETDTSRIQNPFTTIEHYVMGIIRHAAAAWEDEDEGLATDSNAEPATASDAERSTSELSDQYLFYIQEAIKGMKNAYAEEEGGNDFDSKYEEAMSDDSVGDDVSDGTSTNISHEWKIYDHRTEGELHINKQDMNLLLYGESQGDTTLEGAVYGLFAAEDLIHPDGSTQTVYKQNDLVSIAATDRNGDASFMAFTEAPNTTYSYSAGQVRVRTDQTTDNAVNLYTQNTTVDDYAQDGQYRGADTVRAYIDHEADNGNCWIGTPLLLGKYYIKELSRSEGFELSVNGKSGDITNYGKPLDITIPEGEGYVKITQNLYANGQDDLSGESELLFSAQSHDTYKKGYDLVVSGYPAGSLFYRQDTGSRMEKQLIGTGDFELQPVVDQQGNPAYKTAGSDTSDMKLNPDGTPLMRQAVAKKITPTMVSANIKSIDNTKVDQVLKGEPVVVGGIDTYPDLVKNTADFTVNTGEINAYVKWKVEAALRTNGYLTPKSTGNGTGIYSTEFVPVYNRGLREGEPDLYGISGVPAGDPAARTVYGVPVTTLEIDKTTDGHNVSNGDVIETVVEYFRLHPWFNFGGIDEVREGSSKFYITIYNDAVLSSKYFMVLGMDVATDSTIFAPVEYLPDDTAKCPRYVWVQYSNNGAAASFGTYEAFTQWTLGGAFRGEATLDPAAVAQGTGAIEQKLYEEHIYYKEGEAVLDASGNSLQEMKWVEKTTEQDVEVPVILWIQQTAVTYNSAAETYIIHMDSAYTDELGVNHSDSVSPLDYSFKAVTPGSKHGLTAAEVTDLGSHNIYGWTAGQEVGYGTYLMISQKAKAEVYLDYNDRNLTGEDSFIKMQELAYPGQNSVLQDGGTGAAKSGVLERPIMQKIKITKNITTDENGNVNSMKNFRFRTYLKSNLEQLYRAEDGSVIWQDRNGNQVDIVDYRAGFPEKVQKIYTRVPHQTAPLHRNTNAAAMANTELYSYTDGLIHDTRNGGHTRLLENSNYEKFFDAIRAANKDKWDDGDDASTSFKPFAALKESKNSINTSQSAQDNAARSDAVRQFAITWYLDGEVAKLVSSNAAGEKEAKALVNYQEELYDHALFIAIQKAEDYLKPFYAYDLDTIYAIDWDSAAAGGTDHDLATLSADTKDSAAEYFYGVSAYLPYGTYVTVEQQPYRSDLSDLANKHYETDAPKEIDLPAVYEGGKAGSDQKPEVLSSYYTYVAADTPETLAGKYAIRFQEEWADHHTDDRKNYVIHARNNDGDFEIYKYGLALNKLTGAVGSQNYAGITITQDVFDPAKDYYNSPLVNTEEEGGNPESHYLADDGNTGKPTANGSFYEADAIEKRYHYGSISEETGTVGGLAAMQGMKTAYDGQYASMLVPWSVTEPANELTDTAENADGTPSCQGYAYRSYTNTFYASRLRIEKLDSETGENILHDGAIFALYAAAREEGTDSDGQVRFYEADTMIKGSREFLEAMGATEITPFAKGDPGELYSGWVNAGTPICLETEQIILVDEEGSKTGRFQVYSTTRDGSQADETDTSKTTNQSQNVGYLELPQMLGAGVYVLAEIKPTAGYARTKPVAVEIYSDQVSYYLDGNRDDRVAAAIYEDPAHPPAATGPQDTARIYVSNTPIRLEVSKVKAKDNTVTYRTDTRVEGTELKLNAQYGRQNLEFAYNRSGNYLGYAWKKGTLEYLLARQQAGESVEIVYREGIFAGYGFITRPLDTADDVNRYVAGATMTLYDAIEIQPNGDSEDFAYDGVTVVRDRNSNVQSIRVSKGYAGTQTKFVKEKEDSVYTYDDEMNDTGAGIWTYQTIQRETTDILFYSLGGLTLTPFDREGTSIYALKNGTSMFELTGGDLTNLSYSEREKCFTLGDKETRIYHLDASGNRDALVDATTGMAYVTEPTTGKVLVWPVLISRASNGAVIAREKAMTQRIATINADSDREYVTGSYTGTTLEKNLNPVVNGHGFPIYYQRSDHTYQKGKPIYDIDHDYVRYRYSDLLAPFNYAAYGINNRPDLEDIGNEENENDDRPLYYRLGESYVMENTWVTGEASPNDPFMEAATVGRADMLKRVIPGTYIMEEIKAPDGYVTGFPVGITVGESTAVQSVEMVDEKIKVEIDKTDAPDQFQVAVISDYEKEKVMVEPKGAYGYGRVAGSHLALYRAERIYTTDSETYPKGYYLKKSENMTAAWVTDGGSKYLEGIPKGDYILEESEAAAGYVRNSMDIEVKADKAVQTVQLKNDHTKLEIYKYYEDDKGNKLPLPNENAVELALYPAITGADGAIIYKDGKPQYDDTKVVDAWMTDDLVQYTGLTQRSKTFGSKVKAWFGITDNASSFVTDFEKAYKHDMAVRTLTWYTQAGERSAALISSQQADKTESTVQLWKTDEGKDIRITIYRNMTNGGLDENGQLPLNFEYQFNYKELGNHVKRYDTMGGLHRIDYLPFHGLKDGALVGNYVLVETVAPKGFETADAKAIVITETGAVQRFGLKNEAKYIHIDKVIVATDAQGNEVKVTVPGVKLGLYKAAVDGTYIEDDLHLVEVWLTGADGSYTEEDKFNDRILAGYQVGDLKPHKISKTAYGTYYIAELEVPDHMVKNQPQKIEVGAEKVVSYQVINHLSKGTLEITKQAADDGSLLSDARFEIFNENTKAVYYITTGINGKATLGELPVGLVKENGTIEPYTYRVREITPPAAYQVIEKVKRFQFDGTTNAEIVTFAYEVSDSPTSIRFTKTNFDTELFVPGATIAIYKAKAVDGKYIKDGDPLETVVTGTDGFTITKKLIASHVYIVEELQAPAGMNIASPVIFTVNETGTGIKNVSNDFAVLKLNTIGDAIESLTVSGRVPVKVAVILRDVTAGTELIFAGTGADRVLTAADGLMDGHLYEITEYTYYSDGNAAKSQKETRRIHLNVLGEYRLKSRTFLDTAMSLEENTKDDGKTVLDAWTVDPNNHDHIIANPLSKEPIIAKVIGQIGADGSAVKTGDVLHYEITYSNPSDKIQDLDITAAFNENLDYLRSVGGAQENGIVTWRIPDVKPHTNGSAEVTAVVRLRKGSTANVQVKTTFGADIVRNQVSNPIAANGSLTIINRQSGTGTAAADEFRYHVKLMKKDGTLLTGYYAYEGSTSGRIKGEGDLTLTGNGFVSFLGLPYGTAYEVTQMPPNGYEPESDLSKGEIGKYASSAIFTNHKDDEIFRDVLVAGGKYTLTETTHYTGETDLISGKYQFSLNEKGMVDNIDIKDKPVKVYFSKQDITTGEEIAGGHYRIIAKENGKTIYEFTKGSKPVLIPADILEPGKTYVWKEDLAPDGYHYAEEVEFTVDESGIVETVTMEDKKTEVYFSKQDIASNEELVGGHYSVTDKESGETVFEYVANGKKQKVTGLLIAGKTYVFKEDLAPLGYAYSESVEFTVPKEPGAITVTMKDKPTDVIIEKRTATPSDAASPQPGSSLAGAILQILHTDGSPVLAVRDAVPYKIGEELIFTTAETGTDIVKQLTADGQYLLHEVMPGDGYAFTPDVPFTVSHDGRQDRVIMIDKPTHLVASKQSITGEAELPGNHMSIREENGTVIASWISGDKPYKLVGILIAGKSYVLHEESPKDGYSYAADVPFCISLDGTIDTVIMKNEATQIAIRKVNESGILVSGAVLQVLDQSKREVIIPAFTTDGSPYEITGKLTAGETYYLHEIKAPAGYLLAADVAFTVPKEAGLFSVIMTDEKREEETADNAMRLKKVDADTGEGLAGFEFSIYRSDGFLYKTVTTGDGGYAKFPLPQAGTYTYRETKAAAGYLLSNETYQFTVRNNAVTDHSVVSVSNHKAPKTVIQKLASDTGAGLSGAELEIYDENGRLVFAGTTDSSGRLAFYPERPGNYKVLEVNAPEGYQKTAGFITFEVTASGTLTGTFILYNNPDTSGISRRGTITASYDSSLGGRGTGKVKGTGIFGFFGKLPPLGHTSAPVFWLLVITLSGMTGAGIVVKKRRKKDEKEIN